MTKKKTTITSLMARKGEGPKLVVVTAYDATMAELLDRGGADVLMVGDSLGMVIQGHDTTLSVTMEHMIYHCSAVARCRPSAHVVCDLPFMSYQLGPEQALASAGRLVKEGSAESVKLEGGRALAPSVEGIVKAGIPVMGHIGLTPQSIHQMGGFRVQGKDAAAADRLVDDARALEDAGAYSLVVEGVPSDVGERITQAVRIPTIGIGAGPGTDGQVLVSYDLLGMYAGLSPKFVKRYASLADLIVEAMARYKQEVVDGSFPSAEHSFSPTAPPVPAVYGGERGEK